MDPEQVQALTSLGMLGMLVMMVLWIVIVLIPAWKIVSKAGYSGALSLLLFIPIVGFIAIYVFAFADWPVLRRGRQS